MLPVRGAGLWLKAIDAAREGGVWALNGYDSNAVMQRCDVTVPRGYYVNVLTHIGTDATIVQITTFAPIDPCTAHSDSYLHSCIGGRSWHLFSACHETVL